MGHKEGKKNRKFGRSKRSPAHQRYTAAKRWAEHKANRIAKMMRRHKNYRPTGVSEDTKIALARLNIIVREA